MWLCVGVKHGLVVLDQQEKVGSSEFLPHQLLGKADKNSKSNVCA